ncbi:MAG: hypothetical protein EOM74_01275 [Methanomicrobia archaeon]|nr:hypothetical protein [Methanomicrobia archaeon]
MDIKSAIEQLNLLPKGYISKKVIKGKIYYYLQYLDNGKIISKYVPRLDLPIIEKQIAKRKELERFLKLNKKNNPFRLRKNHQSLTGYLMNEDQICAKINDGVLVYINKKTAPLYLIRTGDIASYLAHRILDLSRPNARFLLKQLGIDEKKEEFIALYAHGATIQDHYWFKARGSSKKYEDIRFDNDLYADIALEGKILQLKGLGSPSPEFTNIGSFEKCWRKIDGKWWLYKDGKKDEIFSEYFVCMLAKKIGMPVAEYELDGDYIRSLNFADKYNFEPMFAIADNNENYDFIFRLLFQIDEEIARQYVLLLWFDAIVYNIDRHNQNYGLMRNRKTGKIISLAPNFDNNMALVAYNKTLDQVPEKEQFLNAFVKFIEGNPQAKNLYTNSELPVLTKGIIEQIFDNIPIKVEKEKITQFILNRYTYLHKKRVNL